MEFLKSLQSPKWQGTGKHAISPDLNDLPSGVYLVRRSTNEIVITKKIVVLKQKKDEALFNGHLLHFLPEA